MVSPGATSAAAARAMTRRMRLDLARDAGLGCGDHQLEAELVGAVLHGPLHVAVPVVRRIVRHEADRGRRRRLPGSTVPRRADGKFGETRGAGAKRPAAVVAPVEVVEVGLA